MKKWLSLGLATLTTITSVATIVACGDKPTKNDGTTVVDGQEQKYVTFKNLYENDALEAKIGDMSEDDQKFLWELTWDYYSPASGYQISNNGTWEKDKKEFAKLRADNPRANVINYDRNLTKFILEIGESTLYMKARSWNFKVDLANKNEENSAKDRFPIFKNLLQDSWLKNKILNIVKENHKDDPDIEVNGIIWKSLINWT